ncbi:hypothetical protein CC99x_003435 [Candidatus Berkiella cookevillensis]|uniref:HEPN domain-containing protein n=1 Tax=Candidatus Berkiella cookevillensis TaxID=437022 RepID=A0A0Q9Y9Z1_9GAMM|nr:hypothetical protein [Candidatus Berkiella cookevillensis]MCS5707950.1 hypothetical protein [Candidatus Berkiella cookevillensis]
MKSNSLDNLVKIGQLKKESFSQDEFNGLVSSGKARLKDAEIDSLSPESRFDLAYNAAHALALAALRKCGYRSTHRYIVFQVLQQTTGLGPEIGRILSKCHDQRNLAEYEGHLEVNDQLLKELLLASKTLLKKVSS